MRPVAAIDIGSNTVHLMVGLGRGKKPVEHLVSDSELLELGREVEVHGRIRRAKLTRLEDILREQIRTARKAGARDVLIAATRAMRAADNGSAVVERLERKIEVPVRVLSEATEGHLAFLGAAPELDSTAPQLLIDSGGASTEVTLTRGRRRRAAASLPVGSSLLCSRLDRDPPGPLEWAGLCFHLAEAMKILPTVPHPVTALAIGGSAHRIEELHGAGRDAQIGLPDLERIARRLLRHPARQIARRTGVPRQKVVLLAAGTLILHAILNHYNLDHLRVGHHGLRDGMIVAHRLAAGNWWRYSGGTNAKPKNPDA